jgi:hypothetical protein
MRTKLAERSAATKTSAIVAVLLTLFVTAPFSLAETLAASPLGVIVTSGTVTVGSSAAPTGTTIFAGDSVATTDVPALINLISGSRIEMTKAVATLSRQGKTLLVEASEGLLRFNFLKGEEVQINAGRYKFTAVGKDSAHIGELGVNRNGQVVLTVNEGVFSSLNTVSGERAVVLPNNPLLATELGGKGTVTMGGQTLTDTSKSYKADELKGKCIVAGKEAHQIVANTATVITTKDSWKLNSGTYEYKIIDCTFCAVITAGASAAAAGAIGLSNPLQAAELGGKGTVTKDGKTLTDTSKSYKANELKGKCIVAGEEAHQIVANTATVITTKDSWKLNSGTYEYKITDCTQCALVAAGAAAAAAGVAAAAAAAAAGVAAGAAAAGAAAGAAVGLSTAAVVGIVAGTAAAVGLGVGIAKASSSPSSR